MTLETLSSWRSHGGTQTVHRHPSRETGTAMTFSVYIPDHLAGTKLPVVWYLSGLTCTHANVTEKGEFRGICSELGLVLVAPDTSPRGSDIPDDPSYALGQGAGFYVDATEAPWDTNYRMCSYIENELPDIIAANFPVDLARESIFGHSMGGHGALTIGLRNPDRFRSISAFAPIVSPMACEWGTRALSTYVGADTSAWRKYDACALIEDGARVAELLIDQGASDDFLVSELKPALLEQACQRAGIKLSLRMQPGYDHSYYFISSFMADHLRWHAQHLGEMR